MRECQMVMSSSIQNLTSMDPRDAESDCSHVRIHHGRAILNTDSSVITLAQEKRFSGTTTLTTIPSLGGIIGIHRKMENHNQ